MAKFDFSRRQGLLGGFLAILGVNGSKGAAAGQTRSGPPGTLGEAMPPRYASRIVDIPTGSGIPGLYLSSHFRWHRVLVLYQNGRFRQIVWDVDKETSQILGAQEFTGRYLVTKTEYGDDLVTLGSLSQKLWDTPDSRLLFMQSGNRRYLIRPYFLDSMAFDIREKGKMGPSDDYLFDATPTTPFGEEPYDGRPSPPVEDLPLQLAMLVTAEPLVMTITAVDELPDTQGFWENQRVMCTLSLGEKDCLYINMPIFSVGDSGKRLKGNVWELHPTNCRAGIHYEIDAEGSVIEMPQVGDIFTSKVPR
jgi:hypothetical protein